MALDFEVTLTPTFDEREKLEQGLIAALDGYIGYLKVTPDAFVQREHDLLQSDAHRCGMMNPEYALEHMRRILSNLSLYTPITHHAKLLVGRVLADQGFGKMGEWVSLSAPELQAAGYYLMYRVTEQRIYYRLNNALRGELVDSGLFVNPLTGR
jgi:hypothetical protein